MKRNSALAAATALHTTMGNRHPGQEVILRPSGVASEEETRLRPHLRVSASDYSQRQVITTLPGLRREDGTHAFERSPDMFNEIKYLIIAAQNRFYQSRDFTEAAINAALIFMRTAINFTPEVREYVTHHAKLIENEGDPVVLAFHRSVADIFHGITDRSIVEHMLSDPTGREALRILKNTGISVAIHEDRWPPIVFDNVSHLRRDKLIYDWGRHKNKLVLGSMNSYLGQVHASHIQNLPIA